MTAAHNCAECAPLLALANDLGQLAKDAEREVAGVRGGEYRADRLGLAMGYRRAAMRIRAAVEGDLCVGCRLGHLGLHRLGCPLRKTPGLRG